MITYFPADLRAERTLQTILRDLSAAISNCQTLRELVRAILKYLPQGISYEVELKVRMHRESFEVQKQFTLSSAEEVVMNHLLPRLFPLLNNEGDIYYFYTREDLLSWHREVKGLEVFPTPLEEKVTAIDEKTSSSVDVDPDQLPGLVYGLYGSKSPIVLYSSLLTDPLKIDDLATRSSNYTVVSSSLSGEYSRPYHVEVLWPDGNFYTLRFSSSSFFQGLITASKLLNLSALGENIIWKRLSRFTRNGLEEISPDLLL